MAVVYRHRRLDNFQVFYVGIGKNKYRAYEKSPLRRSEYWSRVVNKCGHEVEIVADNLSYEDAKELECFLIQLYGRKDLGTGQLINMTDGGDGALNSTNRPWSKEIHQFTLEGEYIRSYKSIHEASRDISDIINTKDIAACCKDGRLSCKGFKYSFDKDCKDFKPLLINYPVESFCPNTGELIKSYKSIKDAAKEYDCKTNYIHRVCRGERKVSFGLNWKYKNIKDN